MKNSVMETILGVILLMFFYLVITPAGILLRFVGVDYLDMKIEQSKSTYWNKLSEK